jgi:putative hydrolase of the HAD superfamily
MGAGALNIVHRVPSVPVILSGAKDLKLLRGRERFFAFAQNDTPGIGSGYADSAFGAAYPAYFPGAADCAAWEIYVLRGRRILLEKALFWDFDGTLVLPDAKWSQALYAAVVKYGYTISIEEIRAHLRTSYSWRTAQIAYPESTGPKWWDNLFQQFDLFYAHHMVTKSDSEKMNLYFKEQILNHTNYSLYADTIGVLQACTDMNYKNYILSNNFPELPSVIKGLGLSEFFTDYVVSANIGYEKPREEIFRYALGIANYPDVSYMIGDNPVADIQGGKNVGMKTVLVHKDGIFDADYKCGELSEIPLILAQ